MKITAFKQKCSNPGCTAVAEVDAAGNVAPEYKVQCKWLRNKIDPHHSIACPFIRSDIAATIKKDLHQQDALLTLRRNPAAENHESYLIFFQARCVGRIFYVHAGASFHLDPVTR